MTNNKKIRHRRKLAATLLIGTTIIFSMVSSKPGWTDDRDLLRFNTAKPYLMIMLDTSASMALKMGEGDEWVPGGADNPDSRLLQAKQALFSVFENVNDVHFGFASFNADMVRVAAKHWLYFTTDSIPNGWPIEFPLPDSNDQLTRLEGTDTDGDGIDDDFTRTSDIDGDVLTLGPHYLLATPGIAGTCADPLDLDNPTDRARVQSFAIEASNAGATELWIEQKNTTYLLSISGIGSPNDIGTVSPLNLRFELREVDGNCPNLIEPPQVATMAFKLDGYLNQFFAVDEISDEKDAETTAGLWNWTDVESQADYGSDHPFTGKGWEGNYDSSFDSSDPTFNFNVTNDDPYYCDDRISDANCVDGAKPVEDTLEGEDPLDGSHAPALDTGDMIPFDWRTENHEQFLHRLAPNLAANPAASPEFRIAPYFQDQAVTVDGDPFHELVNVGIRPLAAADMSPLAKTVNDARCWYLGKLGRGAIGKCKNSAFFEEGWESLACKYDTEFGCRRPFFIVISDGEDNIPGEDATADVAALNSQSGVQTWAVNLGNPKSCRAGGGLHPLTQSGKGECVTVATRQELMETLRDILGEIRETARSFASAAVPSVQATVEQKIFLTRFTPLNQESVWDGHIFSYLKPLPLDDGKPDESARCDGSGSVSQRDSKCLLWDAGEVMKDTQVAVPPLDIADESKRRVFYARDSSPGDWPNNRELFQDIDCSADPPAARCLDLLKGFGLLPDPVPGDLSAEQVQANNVIQQTLALKQATVDEVDPDTGNITPRDIEFILGDTFHATPLVLGTPPSSFYFAQDLFGNLGLGPAETPPSCESGNNRGYRCFFRKHQNRRRVLLVGSDDGMLHGFDSGNFRLDATDAITNAKLLEEFDNGTGKELFAYVPRLVMPAVRELAEGDEHQFTVDGGIGAADVFIDSVYDNAGPDPDQREWRTVMVGGLREGGSGYYALDLTQPDYVDFENDAYIPKDQGSYIPSCTRTYDSGKCGPVPYPAPLWEFTDSVKDPVTGNVRLDEDENGHFDLGDSWPSPVIGRIQVCKSGGLACNAASSDPADRADIRDLFVAIVGGGMDVESKTAASGPLNDLEPNGSATRGNWIYMIDIESGEVIYKRQVIGAVPSEIAAVDTNQDSVLDRLYFGTLAGLVYRVDMTPDPLSGMVPSLDDSVGSVYGMDGQMHDVPDRIPATEWVPRVLFDSIGTASAEISAQVRRPLYYRPSVFFIAKLGLYGLAFGSGEREDLWSVNSQEGRFWVFADDSSPGFPPLTEFNFAQINRFDPDSGTDFLLDPARGPGAKGWYLVLDQDERVITDAFALSGVTIFSSFLPRTDVVDSDGDPIQVGCSVRQPNIDEARCAKAGNSNIYAVNTTNANALLQDASSQSVRSIQTATYVSNPFAETGTTRDTDAQPGDSADDLDQRLTDIMNSLKGLFPSNCKFANYRIDVKTVGSDTSLQFIAPIPVCIIDKNWKEF